MELVDRITTRAKLLLERARVRFKIVDIAVLISKRYSDDDGGSYAAALTYYTFLSIFPLLIFAAAIVGFLTFNNPELKADILDAGVEAFPMLKDALTPGGLQALEQGRRQLAITGIVLTLYSGSGAVVALEHALNRFNGVTDEPNWAVKRLKSLGWLAFFGVAVLVSVGLSSAAEYAGHLFDSLPGSEGIFGVVSRLLAVLVSVVIYAAAFRFLPARSGPWSSVLPGAVFAAIGFETIKVLGSTYLQAGNESRNATYGAFATAATLLLASFLVSQVTLLSAEVNAVLAERRRTRAPANRATTEEAS